MKTKITDTPRTDEAEFNTHIKIDYEWLVPAGLAQELERELAAKTKKIEEANSALGFHPDDDTDFAHVLTSLRCEARDNFHQYTAASEKIERLEASLKAVRELCTTDHESKERFIARVLLCLA